MYPTSTGEPPIELSIVVPALNEAESIEPLVLQIEVAMTKAGLSFELIVIDDGSEDATLETLHSQSRQRNWIRVFHQPTRMGQSAAMHRGIQAARAPFVATLDADLQNDPSDLPALFQIVNSGSADMAQGKRIRRKDSLLRKISSWVGRTTRAVILSDTIADTGCSTRVVRTDLATQFPLQFAGMHRFLPVYAKMLGARVIEMPVKHHPRRAGMTKYGIFNRAIAGLCDCFAVRWMRKRLCHLDDQMACADVKTPSSSCDNVSTSSEA